MSVTITTSNIVDIHKAGMRALMIALGSEGTQVFLNQFKGRGDFTKDRHKNPPTHEEAVEGIFRLQEERLKREAGMVNA